MNYVVHIRVDGVWKNPLLDAAGAPVVFEGIMDACDACEELLRDAFNAARFDGKARPNPDDYTVVDADEDLLPEDLLLPWEGNGTV